ncbi:MAG: DMT family transporter [Bacteroidetes bacterium]|nr:DMT family transporter [Bacteroidota bacterium]
MTRSKLSSNFILLLAAIIWGFAFVAQREGMKYLGPFTFNGIRFSLGTLVLLPFLYSRRKTEWIHPDPGNSRKKLFIGVILTGFVLFIGVAFQQLGLQTTTAGKAGFITGLYVVFVPVVGLFWGHRMRIFMWAGVVLAATGLYLLSINHGFQMEPGDFLVLLCAVTFTGHVLLIAWLSPRMDSFFFAVLPFAICSVLNLLVAFCIEKFTLQNIMDAAVPILYGGILSVGIAYTLQLIAQKNTHPASASIILSLESVFAAIGGFLILDEHLSVRSLIGCGLMLSGMLVVQVKN